MTEQSLLPNETESNLPAINEESDDVIGIPLPGYDDTTEKSVVKSVKDIFKGFDPATSTGQFQNSDALAAYAKNTMTDIDEMRKRSDATQLLAKAASLARFWYLGQTINAALSEGAYGDNVIQKLTQALGHAQTYIYEIRNVAIRLSLVDVYLLGMRGLERSDLRRLAAIKDDKMRDTLIKAYINEITNSADRDKMDRARKQLKTALASSKNADAIDIGTSDPNNGGSEVEVTPEWSDAINAIRKWAKMAKAIADETTTNNSVAALANFYLSASVPDAAQRLAELKAAAADTRGLLAEAKKNIEAVIVEIDSLDGVELSE